MDDNKTANETNDSGLNKIDLSQLQSFNFGTQWTEVKPVSPGGRRDFDRGDRRERRDDGGNRGPAQRDRRTFHKPAGLELRPRGPVPKASRRSKASGRPRVTARASTAARVVRVAIFAAVAVASAARAAASSSTALRT